MRSLPRLLSGAVAIIAVLAVAGVASAMQFSSWGTAQKIDEIAGNSTELNTASVDGCPIQSPDGLSLYLASTRPRFTGDTRTDLDIWVATRASTDAPWGEPQNLSAVNTPFDEFCPTPVRGNGLLFVSRKPGGCGLGDIYFTRYNRNHGWSTPERLACAPSGPNTNLDEQGPSRVEIDGSEYLYFSSSRAAGQGGPTVLAVPGEIYASKRSGDEFGPGVAVAGLNDATANDIQPNVRKDGREVVFSSNRAGSAAQDIWASTRESTDDPWSTPINVGPGVNTIASETRPSLSWNADQLLFGRQAPNYAGEGGLGRTDVYVSTRTRIGGGGN